MQRKKKRCIICKEEKYIWAKNACQQCHNKANHKPLLSKGVIKKISERHRKRLKLYQEKRDIFLRENSVCMFPDCKSTDVQLHHRAGRIGNSLYEYFMSCCSTHHEYIHNHPKESYEKGWLISRISKSRL